MRFRGKYVDKGHGGGKGNASKLGDETWRAWSKELSRLLHRTIDLHAGTLNVAFDDDEALGALLAKLGPPFAELRSMKCDPKRDPYHFHKVRMFHESLPRDGKLAFLWHSHKKKRAKIIYKPPGKEGRLEFATETISAKLGDPLCIDFSEALADNPGVESYRNV